MILKQEVVVEVTKSLYPCGIYVEKGEAKNRDREWVKSIVTMTLFDIVVNAAFLSFETSKLWALIMYTL